MLLRIVQSNALLQVFPGGSKLTHKVQGRPQRMVGLHEERRILLFLGEVEELLP